MFTFHALPQLCFMPHIMALTQFDSTSAQGLSWASSFALHVVNFPSTTVSSPMYVSNTVIKY